VQAADLSAAARPAVAELLRAADSTHPFGTFQCERDGEAKWSARIEPRSLSVQGLPELAVFITCDEQPTKLGGAPTIELVSGTRVASPIRLFRCEGVALQLGHDLLVCSAADHDACAQAFTCRVTLRAARRNRAPSLRTFELEGRFWER
jgi:hypothetical protein